MLKRINHPKRPYDPPLFRELLSENGDAVDLRRIESLRFPDGG